MKQRRRGVDEESIGSRIRRVRKLRGLTIAQLAAKTGCSTGYISGLENNPQRSMSLSRIKSFADALGVTEQVLLDSGRLTEIPEDDREFMARFLELPTEAKIIFKCLLDWYVQSRHR
jgi:transcriptional regulator with XRE-family HTH domain